jgi:Uma2 family endonuclease
MSALTAPPPAVPSVRPQPRRWTCAEFHRMGDLGLFEGRRAMLIDGVILEEGPMNPPHRIALELTAEVIRAAFGSGWRFPVQMPLLLGQWIDPEPDIAVVAGSARGTTAHPTTAALVVEVSDTSLRFDLSEKMSLYAAGGIAEYWVVDVTGRALHVFRDPAPDATAPHGHAYATHRTLAEADAITPLAVPAARVAVKDLLP